ncbi:MAG: Asp-tRNA(Asn)/Glu-tRNA(Gln) amidotransferase subunit GatB [Anaerolineae bacterium]
MAYEAIIGMEVHAQLVSASKMFCGCSADYASAPPNTHVCPVCMALPGVLPVINQAAVEATVLAGLALHCTIPPYAKFDRKNYPYPDLPKGYQISQYDLPFCVNGYLDVESGGQTRRVRIRRVHLEEDTAKLTHQGDSSLIDLNRAGVPLMEIVTESDIRSADEAWQYLVKLRAILRTLGVSTGNMEEGAMRCEVNISLRHVGVETLGTKVEIKNLNSFRAVRNSIAYEIERQARLLDAGEVVHQVTMGWDEARGRTVFQRSKEEAQDYRYFPEPDLPPLHFDAAWVDEMRARLPELPDAKRERLAAQYRLRPEDATLLAQDQATASFFEDTIRYADNEIEPQTVANWITVELFRLWRDGEVDIAQSKVDAQGLAELLTLVQRGDINATVAKEVLGEMFAGGESAQAIVARRGLTQISDETALQEIIREILARNPKPVQQFREGKETVIGFLIGQVMRATRGQANVAVAERLLREELAHN